LPLGAFRLLVPLLLGLDLGVDFPALGLVLDRRHFPFHHGFTLGGGRRRAKSDEGKKILGTLWWWGG